MTIWTSQEAEKATGGRLTVGWRATGVSIDTRTIMPGDLFVALRDRRDGHDFVTQALNSGAAAALVERRPEGVSGDAPLLIVDDVQTALEGLGVEARRRCRAKVIAVTGSAGKTSSKDMLRLVLSFQGKTHAAERSYNNHWGVPLTLARMPASADYAVIEIGMNQPGEIAPLSRMARPHAAIITMIAPAHLAAFDSLEDIAKEKSSIFEGLEPGGAAILNASSAEFETMHSIARQTSAQVVTFGSAADAQYRLVEDRFVESGTVARALVDGRTQFFRLAALGRHFAENALGVLAAVAAVDADPVVAALDLGRWMPPDGRGVKHTVRLDEYSEDATIDLLDDAFNANPASLSASLNVLAAARPGAAPSHSRPGRRVAILGDMLELGRGEADMHASFADHPSMDSVAVVHCAGPLMRNLHDALPPEKRGRWCSSAESLADKAHALAGPGDVVLVKGSKGSRISLVAAAIKNLGDSRSRSAKEAN